MKQHSKTLQEELKKVRSQLSVFYELTKLMRTTLRLDEITYIILTGLTAHGGLGFNRASIFLVDKKGKKITGFMGIGAMDNKEALTIWKHIEQEKKDLHSLIKNYHHIKCSEIRPKFLDFIRSLSFPLDKTSGLIFDTLEENQTCWIKKSRAKKMRNDLLVKKLNLGEFLIHPLTIKNEPAGVIVVDNYFTKKPLAKDDIKIFDMFIEQARGAIENSQSFEHTLVRSHTDSLTSLWNYGYFQYRLDEELLKAESAKLPLSIMMIDIDDFKKFNDSHGHIQGDNALKGLSKRLKRNCRKIDILCRYGGEEFSIILPGNNKQEAFLLGERIRRSIEQKNISGSKFTISIGVASFPKDSLEKYPLIKKADKALYRAKKEGKNRIILA